MLNIAPALLLATILGGPCNAHPTYALRPVLSAIHVQHAGKTFTASTSLTFRIVEVKPAMISSVDPGLLDHVQGHHIIAQRVSKSSNGTVRAAGASSGQARARLRQTIARLTADAQKELDREQHVYDSVTNYGSSQSQGPMYGFPGGPDAHDTCVHP
jgi:hypothetical protein